MFKNFKYVYTLVFAILVITLLSFSFFYWTSTNESFSSDSQGSPVKVASICNNQIVDEENNFKFCLPDDYVETNESFNGYAPNPIGYHGYASPKTIECINEKNSYCFTRFFNIAVGSEEIPSFDLYSNWDEDRGYVRFNNGLNYRNHYYNLVYAELSLYSHKLENGKYVYFWFYKGHAKGGGVDA